MRPVVLSEPGAVATWSLNTEAGAEDHMQHLTKLESWPDPPGRYRCPCRQNDADRAMLAQNKCRLYFVS